MDSFPTPPAFEPSRMEAQAESVRAKMRSTRHDEQLSEAERAKREKEKGDTDTLPRRIARWFRRRR